MGFNIKSFSYTHSTFFYEYFFLKYSKLCDELKFDIIQRMNIHNKRVWDPKDACFVSLHRYDANWFTHAQSAI